ncbi:unnamed protein product [Fraxinus pennsylvanica]|uniref:Uncharacterized protein n=1 Tax=Fraxinus pennsylvanica TaxID=56036 RepID=A0AAD2DX90_9LAMI|nr:unnamed protein product [Fraxinus pennsylvanica]
MASVKNFYNQVKGLKVKELPAHVKPMLSIDYLKNSVKRGTSPPRTPAARQGTGWPLIWCIFSFSRIYFALQLLLREVIKGQVNKIKRTAFPERVLSATFADFPGPKLKWEMATAPVPRLDGAAIQIKDLL